jgi:TolA-binding protein
MLKEEERKDLQGIWGLSSIPVVGDLLGHHDNYKAKTDVILTMRAVLVRKPDLAEEDFEAFDPDLAPNVAKPFTPPAANGAPEVPMNAVPQPKPQPAAPAASPLAAPVASPQAAPVGSSQAAPARAAVPHTPAHPASPPAAAPLPGAAPPNSAPDAASPQLVLAYRMAGAAPEPAAQAQPTDAEIEALAKGAMASQDPKWQAQVLERLQEHHFRSSVARERELVLYVQGMLQDQLGRLAQAAVTFHTLERYWPRSAYLAKGQVVLGQAALERKRYQEAESRLRLALAADIPAESQRRAQELLLWCLAEQGRAVEGAPILKALKPGGAGKPSEPGLVGILEAQCAARQRDGASVTLRDYHQLYPDGPNARRVDLDWAKLLGSTGDAPHAAQKFRDLIQAVPGSREADEARLALATLSTDGRLPAQEAQGHPSPGSQLADLKHANLKEAPVRQALLVKGRLAVREGRWQEALEDVAQLRAQHPAPAESQEAVQLRAEALRKWAQELLERHQPAPLLPYLDREGVQAFTPDQRLALVGRLAKAGLPEAAKAVLPLAPPGERPALLREALAGTDSAANPQGALDLLPAQGENAQNSLMRAQAELALGHWSRARAALAKARPGPERIQALVALLNRPPDPGEAPGTRRKEAEAWLARAPEQGAVREPLAILTADLRVREGNWRGALSLYPSEPQPANRGWVALMRATCQTRLGQAEPAEATLKEAENEPSFRTERQALARIPHDQPPLGPTAPDSPIVFKSALRNPEN